MAHAHRAASYYARRVCDRTANEPAVRSHARSASHDAGAMDARRAATNMRVCRLSCRVAHDAALPTLNDGDDIDNAQASSVASVCPPRAAERAPMKSPIGSPEQRAPSGAAPSGAARRREARDARASSAPGSQPATKKRRGSSKAAGSLASGDPPITEDLVLRCSSLQDEVAALRARAFAADLRAASAKARSAAADTRSENLAHDLALRRADGDALAPLAEPALCELERSLRAAADRAADAASARRAAEEQERRCVVCLDQPRTHAPSRCLHLCCCEACSAPLAKCPMCRSALPAGSWRRVYF